MFVVNTHRTYCSQLIISSARLHLKMGDRNAFPVIILTALSLLSFLHLCNSKSSTQLQPEERTNQSEGFVAPGGKRKKKLAACWDEVTCALREKKKSLCCYLH